MYCVEVWGSAKKGALVSHSPVMLLQKNGRNITFSDHLAHTEPVFLY